MKPNTSTDEATESGGNRGEDVCQSCRSDRLRVFHEVRDVPAHSVLLMPTREIAVSYPQGDIQLGFCENCGFISNLAFDARLLNYSSSYEETQGFSPTFRNFHQRLGEFLIDRYDLHNKNITEIGCGKGEFLALLCELGNNRGYGFDPAYIAERNTSKVKERITFIQDFYSETYAEYIGDFVCCKMTLEHIPEAGDFLRMIRRSIRDRGDTVVFFQVPDVTRILRELAFWDIYYEHCSYFGVASLRRLFLECGFEVTDVRRGYGDQYLMIEARPTNGGSTGYGTDKTDLDELRRDVKYFSEHYPGTLKGWTERLQQIIHDGKRVVIWGSGSKCVSFLTTIGIREEIEYTVDINPHKQGMYIPGTGQQIVAPVFLREYRPDLIIVMNPLYCEEIKTELDKMEVSAGIIPLGLS